MAPHLWEEARAKLPEVQFKIARLHVATPHQVASSFPVSLYNGFWQSQMNVQRVIDNRRAETSHVSVQWWAGDPKRESSHGPQLCQLQR